MPPHNKTDDSEASIGESTPIKLGLIIVILGITIGTLSSVGASIWWASNTSAKLDNINQVLQNVPGQIHQLQEDMRVIQSSGSPGLQSLKNQVSDNQERLRLIENQGSPAIVTRLGKMENDLSKLREDFEIHKATTKSTN